MTGGFRVPWVPETFCKFQKLLGELYSEQYAQSLSLGPHLRGGGGIHHVKKVPWTVCDIGSGVATVAQSRIEGQVCRHCCPAGQLQSLIQLVTRHVGAGQMEDSGCLFWLSSQCVGFSMPHREEQREDRVLCTTIKEGMSPAQGLASQRGCPKLVSSPPPFLYNSLGFWPEQNPQKPQAQREACAVIRRK